MKTPRDLLQDGAEAGRAREAREPGEPVVVGGHVFALVRVGAGDEVAVEPFGREFAAERLEARRPLFGGGRGLEGLEHQPALRMPKILALARGSLSKSAASCSVIAPASCSTSVIVTAGW